MENSFTKLQTLAAQQGESMMSLFNLGMNSAQEAVDLNARALRQFIETGSRHAPQLTAPQALTKGELPLGEIARELTQAWTDYLQASQAIARELQEGTRQFLESHGRLVNTTVTESLSEIKAPTPANQEVIDIALRSWKAAAENGFAQATQWQKGIELASEQGTQALAALTAKARTNGTKRRSNAVNA
ncbi:MAG: hypothetical protein H6R14_612 [Proteobacteria bacterium]|nr:hypothetical protein [Pseudomonadota bacterium]